MQFGGIAVDEKFREAAFTGGLRWPVRGQLRYRSHIGTDQAIKTAKPDGIQPKRANFKEESKSRDTQNFADWVVDSGDNGGLPFVIIDKIDAKAFVFSTDGHIRGAAPALLGLFISCPNRVQRAKFSHRIMMSGLPRNNIRRLRNKDYKNSSGLPMFWWVAALYSEGIIVILIDAAPPAPKPINSPAALKLSVSSILSILYRPVIRADISSHIPAI